MAIYIENPKRRGVCVRVCVHMCVAYLAVCGSATCNLFVFSLLVMLNFFLFVYLHFFGELLAHLICSF